MYRRRGRATQRSCSSIDRRPRTPGPTASGLLLERGLQARRWSELDLTKFAGSHEFKLGGDWSSIDTNVQNYSGGAGPAIYMLPGNAGSGGRSTTATATTSTTSPRASTAPTHSTWKIAVRRRSRSRSPRALRLPAGLLEGDASPSRSTSGCAGSSRTCRTGSRRARSSSTRTGRPRLGFVWDVSKNGKSKLYASCGPLLREHPAGHQHPRVRRRGRLLLLQLQPERRRHPAQSTQPDARRSSAAARSPSIPTSRASTSTRPMGGFEYEVAPNFALGAKFTYRKLGRVIEDFLVPSRGRATSSPTRRRARSARSSPSTTASRTRRRRRPSARTTASSSTPASASRTTGSSSRATSTRSSRATTTVSSRTRPASSTRTSTRPSTTPTSLVNAEGRLSAERQHQFKFDGSYEFKGALDGLNIGLSTWYYSGLPQNAYGYSLAYANWEYYLAPRGSLGRGPADYEADLHLGYPIKVGAKSRLNVIADIFNLFNRQSITQYDERYNLINDGACAGIPDAPLQRGRRPDREAEHARRGRPDLEHQAAARPTRTS